MKSIVKYLAITTVFAANSISSAQATGLMGVQTVSGCQVVGDALEARIVQANDVSQFVLCRPFSSISTLGRDFFKP